MTERKVRDEKEYLNQVVEENKYIASSLNERCSSPESLDYTVKKYLMVRKRLRMALSFVMIISSLLPLYLYKIHFAPDLIILLTLSGAGMFLLLWLAPAKHLNTILGNSMSNYNSELVMQPLLDIYSTWGAPVGANFKRGLISNLALRSSPLRTEEKDSLYSALCDGEDSEITSAILKLLVHHKDTGALPILHELAAGLWGGSNLIVKEEAIESVKFLEQIQQKILSNKSLVRPADLQPYSSTCLRPATNKSFSSADNLLHISTEANPNSPVS